MLRIPDDKYTNVMSSLRKHVKEIRLRTDSLSNDITENDDGRKLNIYRLTRKSHAVKSSQLLKGITLLNRRSSISVVRSSNEIQPNA